MRRTCQLRPLHGNLDKDYLLLATTDHNCGGFVFNGPPAPLFMKGDPFFGVNPATGFSSGPGSNQNLASERVVIVSEPGLPKREERQQIQVADPDFTQPALFELGSAFYTGGDVWLDADGARSELIRGTIDNTDIFRIVSDAIRLGR